MQHRLFGIFAATTICAASVALHDPSAASAQTVHARTVKPLVARQAQPPKRGHRLGAHHIFGTILGINGNLLSLQRRNGKFITVDATTAIANDDYSYPLFVGKTVAIDGAFASATTFTAIHVNAITSLQALEVDQ